MAEAKVERGTKANVEEFIGDVDNAIQITQTNGWDNLTAAQRTQIILGILKALRFIANRIIS